MAIVPDEDGIVHANGVRVGNAPQETCSSANLSTAEMEPIAVIGFSLNFPGGATSEDAFWQMLFEGRSAMSEMPQDRGTIDSFHSPNGSRYDTVSSSPSTLPTQKCALYESRGLGTIGVLGLARQPLDQHTSSAAVSRIMYAETSLSSLLRLHHPIILPFDYEMLTMSIVPYTRGPFSSGRYRRFRRAVFLDNACRGKMHGPTTERDA